MQKGLLFVLAVLATASGCARKPTSPLDAYQTMGRDPRRDTQAARQHNARAVKLLQDGKLTAAEVELKAALAADLFFGPAHNNLGTVYYEQEKYYLAAWEFQYAARLMPNRPKPRSNLGLVFEAVGKLDEATKWYEEALQLAPDAVETVGNLARVYVRRNRKDDRTRELLTKIVMKDNRPEWIAWAKDRLALMGQPPPRATEPAGEQGEGTSVPK